MDGHCASVYLALTGRRGFTSGWVAAKSRFYESLGKRLSGTATFYAFGGATALGRGVATGKSHRTDQERKGQIFQFFHHISRLRVREEFKHQGGADENVRATG